MGDCCVCCEEIKKPIECNLCGFIACYKCFSRYLLEGTVNPKCMKCDKPWSRKNLVNSFGQYFVSNKYKKKRENVLFEMERAMLPATQPIAARERRIFELNRQAFSLETEISKIDSVIARLDRGVLDSEFEEFLEKRKTLRLQRQAFKEEITNIQYRKSRLTNRPTKIEKNSVNSAMVIKCPNECKGYINTKNGTCELCKTVVCKECHVTYSENHECKKEDIETVRLLQKDSKNCPTCKSIIHKIDGCDQMFCTQCHTAFSWRTGEICAGRIHNPHYYEYLRKMGTDMRELGDIPCGGLPYANRFIIDNQYLRRAHRIVSHVENHEIPRLTNDVNNVNGNLDLRIAYLNERLPEFMFKQEIYKREKALEKKREILTVLNTFVVVCSDIFRTCVIPESRVCVTEFENIRNFTNETLYDVSRVYKCVVPVITIEWSITSDKYVQV
jgi:hypothetical protein